MITSKLRIKLSILFIVLSVGLSNAKDLPYGYYHFDPNGCLRCLKDTVVQDIKESSDLKQKDQLIDFLIDSIGNYMPYSCLVNLKDIDLKKRHYDKIFKYFKDYTVEYCNLSDSLKGKQPYFLFYLEFFKNRNLRQYKNSIKKLFEQLDSKMTSFQYDAFIETLLSLGDTTCVDRYFNTKIFPCNKKEVIDPLFTAPLYDMEKYKSRKIYDYFINMILNKNQVYVYYEQRSDNSFEEYVTLTEFMIRLCQYHIVDFPCDDPKNWSTAIDRGKYYLFPLDESFYEKVRDWCEKHKKDYVLKDFLKPLNP